MSTNYTKHFSTRATTQDQPLPGRSDMVQNHDGAYVFQTDDWKQLDRFLIIGAEGSSYYASEKERTIENAKSVERCLKVDGVRTVRRIVEISLAGRAPKNDPAIFALAMATVLGDEQARTLAYQSVPQVCRTGTHLMQYTKFREAFGGWGTGAMKSVRRWFTDKSADDLAYQAVKYQSREGWSMRDVLRVAHPKTQNASLDAVLRYIQGGTDALAARTVTRRDGGVERSYTYPAIPLDALPRIIQGVEKVKSARTEKEVAQLIADYRLPREVVPTEFLNSALVWEALLQEMPMTAMVRNLAKMTAVGLLAPMSAASRLVIERLGDQERIRRSRIHPFQLLVAARTYSGGRGLRGSLVWSPLPQVVDAVDSAFYASFGNVEPTGKARMLALDVSGSMGWQDLLGVPGLTPRVVSACFALVVAKTEPNYHIMAFTHQLTPVNISPRMRLDDAIRAIESLSFGATDCSLPMRYALENKLPVDSFEIYTDSETNAYGRAHPATALREFRQKMSRPEAKMVVHAMESNRFSIADPNDIHALDVVGLDSATPSVIAEFVRG